MSSPRKNKSATGQTGLRNADGTGVMAGLTHVCNVHGYLIADGDKIPDKGELTYRGINIEDIVQGCQQEDRFGFEEVAWLLIFGHLPTRGQYESFSHLLYENRELPECFPEDMIIKAPSKNIMNKLARSVLALYSMTARTTYLWRTTWQSISLIARMPLSCPTPIRSSAATSTSRVCFSTPTSRATPRRKPFSTPCARTGSSPTRKPSSWICAWCSRRCRGGNNSTFTTRVLTSAGTDIYSAIGAAVGSLKGFKHGGANHQVRQMMDDLMDHVENWEDPDEVEAYLEKILRGEAADGSGLIYGMGHAIYTLSDPRAVILKGQAQKLAQEKGFDKKLRLYQLVEELSPRRFRR